MPRDSGYPVGVRAVVRDCVLNCCSADQPAMDCHACTAYACDSFVVWDDETNGLMERALTDQLLVLVQGFDQFRHWTFTAESSPRVWLEARVVEEGGVHGGATLLALDLLLPQNRRVRLAHAVLYPAQYFEGTTLLGLNHEQAVLERALSSLFQKEAERNELESEMLGQVPVARLHQWLDETSGRLVLPLPRAKFDHLSKALFKAPLLDRNDSSLIFASDHHWGSFPGLPADTFQESLVTVAEELRVQDFGDDDEVVETSQPFQPEHTRFSLGPVFLIQYIKPSPFAMF